MSGGTIHETLPTTNSKRTFHDNKNKSIRERRAQEVMLAEGENSVPMSV